MARAKNDRRRNDKFGGMRITPVNYQRLVCVFKKAGFIYSRTSGDHLIYVKIGCARPLVIPKYANVPIFVIKNLMRLCDMDRTEYFKLLAEC